MDQNQFQEDVQYIKRMIENNRRTIIDNGLNYLITGILVAIGVIISSLPGISTNKGTVTLVWFSIIAVIIISNLTIQYRIGKSKIKRTFITNIYESVWIVCGFSVTVITILYFITWKISLPDFFLIIATILGIGYYLTGVINELSFMKVLAFGWWIGGILSILWGYIGQEDLLPLLFSCLIIPLEIIPGIIIYKKWKRLYHEQAV